MLLELDNLKEGQRKLAEELRKVVHDAQEMLNHQIESADDGYRSARKQLAQSVEHANRQLQGAERALLDQTRKVVRETDHYVHDHPWESVGVSAGIGLLVGLLIARR